MGRVLAIVPEGDGEGHTQIHIESEGFRSEMFPLVVGKLLVGGMHIGAGDVFVEADLVGIVGGIEDAADRLVLSDLLALGAKKLRQPAAFRKTPSKNSFKDYHKTHFAYDMLQLRRLNRLAYNDLRLNFGTATIETTGDTARAMFLATGANEGQFIKDLYFTKE